MKAIEDGFEYIAAVGGDGTINEIAKCLVGKEQVLVIVPLGSGNGLARHLELPFRPDYVGKNVPTSLTEHICVELPEYDNSTSVKLYKIK